MKRLFGTVCTAGLLLIAGAAAAQGTAAPTGSGYHPATLWDQVVSTIVFSMVGILIAILGFKLFDLAIKFDVEKEICEKNNMSAALLAASVILGTCIIVACVVLS